MDAAEHDARARICVVGSINADLTMRVDRLPKPGETVIGGSLAVTPGGKGANQAVSAARLGAQVQMVGTVGDDEHAGIVLRALKDAGVGTREIARAEGVPTGLGMIVVDSAGENMITVASGANASDPLTDSSLRAIARADIMLAQLEVPMGVVARAANAAREQGTFVIINAAPAPRRELRSEFVESVLPCTDLLIVNEHEAAAIVGGQPFPAMPFDESIPERVRGLLSGLLSLGAQRVCVTLGRGGAALARRATGVDSVYAPAFEVDAIDSVGAGDAFVGTMAARLAELRATANADVLSPLELTDLLSWACAAGALACTREGAIPAMPARAEVISLLRSAPLGR